MTYIFLSQFIVLSEYRYEILYPLSIKIKRKHVMLDTEELGKDYLLSHSLLVSIKLPLILRQVLLDTLVYSSLPKLEITPDLMLADPTL